MKILCDLDDVLWELVPKWTEWLYIKHGIKVSPEDIKTWDMAFYYPSLSKQEVFAPLFDPLFFEKMQPVEGAMRNLCKLQDNGHEIFVVTATHHSNVGPKIDTFLKMFPMIDEQHVIITGQKSMIDGDVLIDDSADQIKAFESTHRAGLLFDRPHNRYADWGCRCESWEDVYLFVNIIQKVKEIVE